MGKGAWQLEAGTQEGWGGCGGRVTLTAHQGQVGITTIRAAVWSQRKQGVLVTGVLVTGMEIPGKMLDPKV